MTTARVAALLASLGNGPADGQPMTREEWSARFHDADAELRRIERAELARADLATVPSEFSWVLGPEWKRLLVDRCKLPPARMKTVLEANGDVLLRGPSGTGKTSLAIALFRRRVESGYRGRFVGSVDLAQAQVTRARNDKAERFLVGAQATSLVLLDDIGFELAGGKASAVCDLVYARRGGRTNIWTTAFSDEQLSQHYGDGIRRRLTEAGRVMVVEIPTSRTTGNVGP